MIGASEFIYTNLLAALCGFLLLVALLQHYAPRTPLPAASWLLLAGFIYGLVEPSADVLPPVRLNPEVVVTMLLPLLVFAQGRNLPVALLLRSTGPVAALVLLGTPIGMLLIGVPVALMLDIPYLHGLLFAITLVAYTLIVHPFAAQAISSAPGC